MTFGGTNELQKAVIKVLTDNLDEGVFNYVEEDDKMPYVVFRPETIAPFNSSGGIVRYDIRFLIDCFSSSRGSARAQELAAKVANLLHERSLTLTGYRTIYLELQGALVYEPDNHKYYRVQQTYKAMVEPT